MSAAIRQQGMHTSARLCLTLRRSLNIVPSCCRGTGSLSRDSRLGHPGLTVNEPPPSETTPDPSDPVTKETTAGTVVVRSADLLKGGNEVLIEHQGSLYRLRQTRNGKLILHK